jgi:hypothetical protein
MLERTTTKAAARQRHFRQRVRECKIVVQVEVDETIIDFLILANALNENESEDRQAIGRGIAASLTISALDYRHRPAPTGFLMARAGNIFPR